MHILKQSTRQNPRVSLILLDWGVRESLHLLHYLKSQTVPRDTFEVIIVEYYDHVSEAVREFESEVDTWILLQMPEDCYYHKHLMYNAGIIFGKGDILMMGDSDAMVRPSFIERIVTSFDREQHLVYHMDEFRNVRRDLYPFNYPSFDDVLGEGCINNVGGKTKGVLDAVDPIHTRNYGACMCARRDDIIAIGGADEDLTYLGHICGPYDMTFRLMNSGLRLKWETEEYLYHTWHPGTDGTDNYLGPHDGLNVSTTALQALTSGRIQPHLENQAIRKLRIDGRRENAQNSELLKLLIDPEYKQSFNRATLGSTAQKRMVTDPARKNVFMSYKGFDVYQIENVYYAVPESLDVVDITRKEWRSDDRVITEDSFDEIRRELDNYESRLIESSSGASICAVGQRFAVVPHSVGAVDFRNRRQRQNDQILWADSLKDARAKTAVLNGGNLNPIHSDQESETSQQIAELNRRLTQVEANIKGIYHSGIWRTLCRISAVMKSLGIVSRQQ